MFILSEQELKIKSLLQQLKKQAGSHSPSIWQLTEHLNNIKITIDACFLSNPYATDLFEEYLQKDLISSGKLREILEYYPSQNAAIARKLSPYLNVEADRIFIGNGASEIIQALLHHFVKKRMAVILPTFSPYYEYAREDVHVFFHYLKKENEFKLNVPLLFKELEQWQCDTLVLINPNNPDGSYLSQATLRTIFEQGKQLEQIIVDESFIHFAYEDDKKSIPSCISLCHEFNNLIIVKSMSKDFGIAGIRAGYGIMHSEKVKTLLKNGYLWNSCGLAEYFFNLLSNSNFLDKYEALRLRYISEMKLFYKLLEQIPEIKVYPSKANFYLIELLGDIPAEDLALALLIRNGIYVRLAKDKIGLRGEFIRIASRRYEENRQICEAISKIFY